MKRTFVVLFFSIVMSCTVLGMKRRAGGHESIGMPRVKRNMGGDLYHRLQIIKFFGNCDNCKVMSLREVTNSPEIGFSMCKYEEEKDFVNTTRKEWEAMSVFSAFAQEMSRLSIGDAPTKLIALARSLMKAYAVYEAECEEIRFFVRENSDFYFCCGLVAYYLGEL